MSEYKGIGSKLIELNTSIEDLINGINIEPTFIEKYRDDPIKYFETRHNALFPPKIRIMFNTIYNRIRAGKDTRVLMVGPRGSGKSYLVAMIEYAAWMFLNAQCVNLGGSEEQARAVYDHISGFLYSDSEARDSMGDGDLLRERITKGGIFPIPYVNCRTASEKSVRGPHPGRSGVPGVLVIDEVFEAEDDIVRSALPMINTADPKVLIMLTTFHKPTGIFQEFWDANDIEIEGFSEPFIRYSWDAFDISKPCNRDCNLCHERIRNQYCKYVCDCIMPNGTRKEHHPAHITTERCPICGAKYVRKARLGGGWLDLADMFFYVDKIDTNTFETDYMGLRPSIVGGVLDSHSVDSAIARAPKSVDRIDFSKYSYKIGIDWGARGQTAILVAQIDHNRDYILFKQKAFNNTTDTQIREWLDALRVETGITEVWADQSHPFQNDYLARIGFSVHPVNFHKFKEDAVGVIKYYFEANKLFIMDCGHDTVVFTKQLKGWRRNKMGRIVKRNDHFCDALICLMLEEFDYAGYGGSTDDITIMDDASLTRYQDVVGRIEVGDDTYDSYFKDSQYDFSDKK